MLIVILLLLLADSPGLCCSLASAFLHSGASQLYGKSFMYLLTETD